MDPAQASQARGTQKDRPVEPAPQGEVDQRRAQQAHQVDDLAGTPTTPVVPKQMFSGMLKGAAIGAVVGAVVLSPLALVPILDLPAMSRLIICWIVGAVAGGTMGAVFLAGARSETTNPENEEYLYAGTPNERRDGPGLD